MSSEKQDVYPRHEQDCGGSRTGRKNIDETVERGKHGGENHTATTA